MTTPTTLGVDGVPNGSARTRPVFPPPTNYGWGPYRQPWADSNLGTVGHRGSHGLFSIDQHCQQSFAFKTNMPTLRGNFQLVTFVLNLCSPSPSAVPYIVKPPINRLYTLPEVDPFSAVVHYKYITTCCKASTTIPPLAL